jgi:hypothetical protein
MERSTYGPDQAARVCHPILALTQSHKFKDNRSVGRFVKRQLTTEYTDFCQQEKKLVV